MLPITNCWLKENERKLDKDTRREWKRKEYRKGKTRRKCVWQIWLRYYRPRLLFWRDAAVAGANRLCGSSAEKTCHPSHWKNLKLFPVVASSASIPLFHQTVHLHPGWYVSSLWSLFFVVQLKEHLKTCPRQVVSCYYSPIACTFQVKKSSSERCAIVERLRSFTAIDYRCF